jgi:hypothetical protein
MHTPISAHLTRHPPRKGSLVGADIEGYVSRPYRLAGKPTLIRFVVPAVASSPIPNPQSLVKISHRSRDSLHALLTRPQLASGSNTPHRVRDTRSAAGISENRRLAARPKLERNPGRAHVSFAGSWTIGVHGKRLGSFLVTCGFWEDCEGVSHFVSRLCDAKLEAAEQKTLRLLERVAEIEVQQQRAKWVVQRGVAPLR